MLYLPPVPSTSREDTGALAVVPSTQSSFRFPQPRQSTAIFGNITVHYDAWSDYVEPTVYALRDQQRIVNWTDVRGLTFSGEGLQYIQCLQLHHCVFTPEQPCRTLFSVTHVRYIVVPLGKLATHDVLKTTHFDENGAYFYFFSTVQQCFVKRRLFFLLSTVQQCFGPTAP